MAEPPQDSRHDRLSPLTGEFLDPAREAAFRLAVRPVWRRRARMVIGVGLVAYLLTGIGDWFLLGAGPAFAALLAGRVLVLGAGLLYLYRLRRGLDDPAADRGLLAFLLLMVGVFLLMVGLRPDGVALSAPACILMICVFYMVQMTCQRVTLAATLTLSAGMLAVAFWIQHSPAQQLVFLGVQIMVGNLLGFFVGRGRHQDSREAWLQQQALVSSERLSQNLADFAPVGIFRTDLAGHNIYVNRRWSEIAGLDAAQTRGTGWRAGLHPEDRERITAQWLGAVAARQNYQAEHRLLRPDGATVWIHVLAQPELDADGRAVGYIGTVEDISERRAAQAALEQRSQELERSNADLQQFAYVASHDLLEPLRIITNYSKLLQERAGRELSGESLLDLQTLAQAARRMHQLINDLLAYSRIGAQVRPFVPCALDDVAELVRVNLESSIRELGATLRLQPLPEVLADPLQMVQLLQHLVGNAIKFHGSEAPVVEIGAGQQDGSWLITVADNGIGVRAEHRQRIFDLMQRLHTQDQYPGTGIGLPTCRRIVERHGGRIWVEPNSPQGARFCFTLPAAARLAA